MNKEVREQILNEMVQSCEFVDTCEKECSPSDHEECYGNVANNVLVAIKELGYRLIKPESLTVLDDEEISIQKQEHIDNGTIPPEGYHAKNALEYRIAQAQRDHDASTQRVGMGSVQKLS